MKFYWFLPACILFSVISVCSSDRFEIVENEYGIPRKFHGHIHHHPHRSLQDTPSAPPVVVNLNSAKLEVITNPSIPPPPPSVIGESDGPENIPGVVAFENPGFAPFPIVENSESLCPSDGPQQRYFNETGKCYTPGKGENPCGQGMQFYALAGDKVYGDCDCAVNVGCDYRPLVYWLAANKCFHVFQQGPCKAGQWLILDRRSNPVCVNRTCPENTDSNPLKTWVSLKNTCYQLTTQGFCKQSNETLHYTAGSIIPTCHSSPVLPPGCGQNRALIAGAPTLPCGPGQKKTGSGACGTSVGFI